MPLRRASAWMARHGYITILIAIGIIVAITATPIVIQANENRELSQQNEQTLILVQAESDARAQAVIEACELAARRVGLTFDELFEFMRDGRTPTPRLDAAEAIADRNLDPASFCHPVIDPEPVVTSTTTTNP